MSYPSTSYDYEYFCIFCCIISLCTLCCDLLQVKNKTINMSIIANFNNYVIIIMN